MTKRLTVPYRCGKTIGQYICPDCKVPLRRVTGTLFECPLCNKKVKAFAKSLEIPYDNYYAESNAKNRIKKLFMLEDVNCSDKVDDGLPEDVKQNIIDYLQAYHRGNVKELKK